MQAKTKTLYGGLRALERELADSRWQNAKYTVLLDENTFQHCLPLLAGSVEQLQEADFIEVPDGEECKSLEVASQVWQTMLESRADREAVLVNLGGGAVCDLGGFVAADYKRGIRHINIPTTLLAMADAAIGGKTAIDFGGVKNSIGHFYPAALTVLDTAFLATLPDSEVLNGLVEMVKTAAVTDAALYSNLLAASAISPSTVKQVARIKARVAKADPCDRSIRKILNFGHTFGHAFEAYYNMPHGKAVGIGMSVAMYLSSKKVGLPANVCHTYNTWLRERMPLPEPTLKDIEQMLPLMHQDKKNSGGGMRCVLLQEPGAAVIDVEISDNEVRDAMLKLAR